MADCTHNCESCGSNCEERTDFMEKPLESTHVKKVIGVVSGKGGVGKSSVTAMLAVAMNREGYEVAVMDADITGPSIPRAFGITAKAQADDEGIIPVATKTGIKTMSINLLLENDSDPVVWRGPVIGGAVKQFWTDVVWGDVDYMFVDMPPGTGDVALTVFQSLPVDGIIVVTTPQDMVSMIVEKAAKMADMMNVPILAMVENMSYYECPDCGKQHAIFGISNIEAVSVKYGVETIAKLPINPKVAAACDRGMMELADVEALRPVVDMLESLDGVEVEPCDGVCEDCAAPCAAPAEAGPAYEDGVGKIAVPYENGQVCEHFGHAPQFKIYRLKGLEVIGSEVIDNDSANGHAGAVDVLWKNGVEIVICGNIGDTAAEMLAAAGIMYFPGVKGDADKVISEFVNGTLEYDFADGGCGGAGGSCGGGGENGCGGCCSGCC